MYDSHGTKKVDFVCTATTCRWPLSLLLLWERSEVRSRPTRDLMFLSCKLFSSSRLSRGRTNYMKLTFHVQIIDFFVSHLVLMVRYSLLIDESRDNIRDNAWYPSIYLIEESNVNSVSDCTSIGIPSFFIWFQGNKVFVSTRIYA